MGIKLDMYCNFIPTFTLPTHNLYPSELKTGKPLG